MRAMPRDSKEPGMWTELDDRLKGREYAGCPGSSPSIRKGVISYIEQNETADSRNCFPGEMTKLILTGRLRWGKGRRVGQQSWGRRQLFRVTGPVRLGIIRND